MTRRDLILILVLLAVFWLAAIAGLPERLGAHPWWAVRSGIVGSLIGAAVSVGVVFARLDGTRFRWLAGIGLVSAIASATFGKRAFAASLAENALAGRFWFFGWFAISACFFLVAFLIVRHRIGR